MGWRIIRIRGSRWAVVAALAAVVLATAPAVAAQHDPCAEAITAAEAAEGLPAGLLGAIARVESGRRDPETGEVAPWPWTINSEGAGMHFDSRQQAVAEAAQRLARGVGVIDVGCMQINLYHHPAAFRSLAEAFEPATNVAYAARFLKSLHAKTGDWGAAVARYHNADPAIGTAYRQRVYAAWQGTGGAKVQASQATVVNTGTVGLGHEAFASGSYLGAVAWYDMALVADPDDRAALLGKALAHDRLGAEADARSAYSQVLMRDPGNAAAVKGTLAIIQRQAPAERAGQLLALREFAPDSAEIAAAAAVALAGSGDLATAAGLMEAAARLEPGEPRHRLNLAVLLDRLGHRSRAMGEYEAFLTAGSSVAMPLTVSRQTVIERLHHLKSAR